MITRVDVRTLRSMSDHDPTQYDTDGDGVVDMVVSDDSDGLSALLDLDGSGSFETVLVDTDGDRIFETMATDTDDDGVIDTIGVDLDLDGYVDVVETVSDLSTVDTTPETEP